jgi:heat shock protein HslJ/membrane-bound inhibitor of C-type lysozyme
MKKVLILMLVLVVLGAGYYVAVEKQTLILDESPVVYSGQSVEFVGPAGMFAVQYSADMDAAELTYNDVQYDLQRARAASGAKYTSVDQSVVFWEAGGEAFVEIDGVTVVENAVSGESDQSSEVQIFTVAPQKVECVGVAPMECLVVNGEYFYDDIQGFTYEPGYQYTLQVERTERENVPADASAYVYSLLEVMEKAPVVESTLTLTDAVWQWQETTMTDGTTFESQQPEAFTLTFTQDGQVNITTDCNNGFGSYTYGEKAFAFGAIAATEKACLGETQETEFFAMLSVIGGYTFTAEENLLLTAEDSQMLFVPAQ